MCLKRIQKVKLHKDKHGNVVLWKVVKKLGKGHYATGFCGSGDVTHIYDGETWVEGYPNKHWTAGQQDSHKPGSHCCTTKKEAIKLFELRQGQHVRPVQDLRVIRVLVKPEHIIVTGLTHWMFQWASEAFDSQTAVVSEFDYSREVTL